MKKHAKRLMAWMLVFNVLMTSNAVTSLASEGTQILIEDEDVSAAEEDSTSDVVETEGEEDPSFDSADDVIIISDEDEEASTNSTSEEADDSFESASVEEISEGYDSDGAWLYKVVDGYATVMGYTDYSVKDLDIPDMLGGYYVNAIGEKAFAYNKKLGSMYIHGNVLKIDKSAFPNKKVEISGFNGTSALKFARENEIPYVNRTDIGESKFQEKVIDFTYADSSRFEYLDEFTVKMNLAEANNLEIGSLFYIPIVYEDRKRNLKVEEISFNEKYATITVSEASMEETMEHLEFDEELTPDWSKTVWADGVEVVQEKFEAGTSINEKIVINYEKSLGKKKLKDEERALDLKVAGSAEIGLTGAIKVDADIFPVPSFNSFDLNVDIDGQVSGGIQLGLDNDDFGKSKFDKYAHKALKDPKYFKGLTKAVEKKEYDILLGAVPLNGKDKETSIYVGLYVRIGISGKIEIVSKVHGSLMQISYKKGQGWSRNHSVQWNPLSVSAAVDIDFGLVAIAEAKCWGLGKCVDIELFAGLNASAELNVDIISALAKEYTTAGGAGVSSAKYENFIKCADIEIKIKVEATIATDLDILQKVLKKSPFEAQSSRKWKIFGVEWPLKSWHLEAPGLDFIHWKAVDKCTNSFATVSFYTGTAEKLNNLKIQNNTALGIENEPTTDASQTDKRYILKQPIGVLEGWYIYENCSGPDEYKQGKGSKRKWDFAKDKVKGDMTLYAEWRSDKAINVVYKPNFTSNDPARPVPTDITQQALEGALLTNPGQFKRKDYRFQGYSLKKDGTTYWNFSTDTVTQDKLTGGKLVLYAIWQYEQGYDPDDVDTDNHGRMSFNGHSYTHIATYKSYAEAEADAKAQGGYLCTINSAEEQAFLAKYMYQDCAQTYLWLGMTSNDGWEYWKTGERVNYTNWETDPSATSDQYNAAIIRTSGKWTTLSNTQTAHYVIEWGTPNSDPGFKKKNNSEFTFTTNDDGVSASVTGIDKAKSNMVIPKVSPEGLTVTGIVEGAFLGNSKIETISIPNTVTYIGKNAFENCTKLKEITIPNSVTSIGNNVFKGCTGLEKVIWSNKVKEIPDYTFYGCTKLSDISNIGEITAIKAYAFYNCSMLSAFVFPKNLTTIQERAFYNASSLREAVIPDKVTNIGQYAFYGCRSIYKISLPEGLTQLSYYSFGNCTSASDIYLPKSITKNNFISGCLYNVTGTFHLYKNSGADEYCTLNNKTIEYLDSKQKVKFNADYGSAYEPTAKDGSTLDEAYIEVGKRITEPKLTRDGFVVEGWYLEPEFTTKWNFASNKVPDHNITLYAKWVSDPKLFQYNVVDGSAQITAYTGNSSAVIIPEKLGGYTVTSILKDCFVSDDIYEIVIPSGVKSIAAGAFDCAKLESLKVTGGKYFAVHEDGVLYSANAASLVYAPQGIRYDEYRVPEGTKKIYGYAFRGQKSLEKLFIPDSTTSIGSYALEGNLTATIYGSVKTCAAKTYAEKNNYNYNLYIIHYVYGDTSLYTGTAQAGSLIKSYFEPMSDFFSYGGWYKDADTTQEWNFAKDKMPQSDITLYLKWDTLFDIAVTDGKINITGYRGTATKVVIPETIGDKQVVGIDSGAFLNTKVKSVQIPDCVTKIEDSAFPSGVTLICSANSAARKYAVENKLKYKDLKYTIHFEVYGGSQVKDMSVVPGKKVTLPIPVRTNFYFNGWYTDTSYTDSVKWTETTVMPNSDVTLHACWRSATSNVTNDFAYKVLKDGTMEITEYAGDKTVLSVPSTLNGYSVTRIGDHAFEGNKTIVSITLPKTIKSIGRYAFADTSVRTVKGANALTTIEEGAFRDASALSSIALTAKLRTIGDSAFLRCTSLTGITIPEGTTSIGNRAFYGCEFLGMVTLPGTLTTLGKEAFCECPKIAAVSVPVSVKNLAQDAFDKNVEITFVAASAVNFTSININGKKLSVEWNKVKNAKKYAFESKKKSESAYIRNCVVTANKASVSLSSYTTYNFKVIALDANDKVLCESKASSILVSKIATPSIASVTQYDATSATMVLNPVEGVDGYEVERAYSETDKFTLLKEVKETSFRNSGLMKGFEYYYRVRAFKKGTDGKKTYSRYSDVYHFTMHYKYVVAPANLTSTQSAATQVKLVWDKVADAEGYIVYRSADGAAFKKLAKVLDSTATDKKVKAGSKYEYKVSAYYTENGKKVESKKSKAVAITVQSVATPALKSVKQNDAKSVTLTWTEVKGATGYKLYRKDTADGKLSAIKTLSGATSFKYSAKFKGGNTYYFTVRAYVKDKDGKVTYSNYAPVQSLDFSAVVQASGIKVSQSASNKALVKWSAINGVTGYEVWMSTANNSNYELAATTAKNEATVKGLKDGTTYYFKVRGYKTEGSKNTYGLYSKEVSLKPMGTPKLQVAEQNGKNTVQLIFSKIASADGYEVLRKTGTEEYTLAKTTKENTVTVYSLTVGSEYSFMIRPYRLDKNKNKVYGFKSNELSVFILGTTKITSLKRANDTSLTLKWNKAAGANGYNVYRMNLEKSAYEKIKTLTGTSFTDKNLEIGSVYYYRVVPYRTVGKNKVEGIATATKGMRLIQKPVITSVEQTENAGFKLNFNKVPNCNQYRIYHSETENGTYSLLTTATFTNTNNNTALNATVEGLKKDSWHYFMIDAGSAEDNTVYYSNKSDKVSVYLTSLLKPEFKEFKQKDTTGIVIGWNKVAGAAGYDLMRSEYQNNNYTVITTLTGTSYVDKEVTLGRTYYYIVKPYKMVGSEKMYGPASNVGGARLLSQITFSAIERTSSNRVLLTWTRDNYCSGYYVYRSDSKKGTYTLLKTAYGTYTYDDYLTVGAKYYYKIAPIYKSGVVNCIGLETAVKGITMSDVGSTTIREIQQTGAGAVKVTWDAVADAAGYDVFVCKNGDSVFTKAKSSTKTSLTVNTNLEENTYYKFKVRAYKQTGSTKEYGPMSNEYNFRIYPSTKLEALYQTSNTAVRLKWTSVSGMKGYEVYRKIDNGKYEKIKDTTDLTMDETGLTVSKTYCYKVRGYYVSNNITHYTGFSESTLKLMKFSKGTYPESPHDYTCGMDQSWSYTMKGVSAMAVTFVNETYLERPYDKLYITDKDGNKVGSDYYSGNDLAGKTIIVPGNTLNIRMTTDGSVVKYGFAIEMIAPAGR